MCSATVSVETPVSAACFAVLKLSSVKGLGLKTFHQLHSYFSYSENILYASYESLVSAGLKPALARAITTMAESLPQPYSEQEERLFEWVSQADNYVLCLEDDDYPAMLKEVFSPPPLLYIQGQLSAFDRLSVAIIGSRRPTVSGQRHASAFAMSLAELNVCVTSGLAIGIDTCAHQGALEVDGISCAVLGSGLGQIYPKQNQYLASALKEQGALVSELALDVKALPANFPRRNRIISGLSQGVLVVEAGLKSGSLITAEFAIEQNREVFAIPGGIDHPLSRGCHALIKQGASLVESVEDIVQQMGAELGSHTTSALPARIKHHRVSSSASEVSAQKPSQLKSQVLPEKTTQQKNYSHLSQEEQKVMSVLSADTTSFDDLSHCLSMNATQLNTLLVTLELKGELCSVLGGYRRT